jgi:hemolysin activation/secretion protein
MVVGKSRSRARRFGGSGVGLVLIGLAAAHPAHGQSLPPSADPNRVDQRLVEPPRPRSTPALQIEGPDAAPPPAQARAIRFDLAEIKIEGTDRVPADEIAALVAPLVGREVTLLEIYELRDAVTARLRASGFVLSQAIIPAQRVEAGVLRIDAIEGFIADVAYEGATSPAVEAALAPYVAPILAERPLRAATLERQLLLMDDLPGLGVRSVLRPNDEVKGGTTLVLLVEPTPFGGSVTVDNRGSRAIGPIQADLTAEARLFEHKLAVRTLVAKPTDELMLGDAAWTTGIGTLGTTFTVGARKSVSKPGGVARTNGVHSDTRSLRVAVSHPLFRSSAETVRLTAEASMRTSRSQQAFGTPQQRLQSEDRLRVLALTGAWDFSDALGGTNVLQATVTKGFGGLGANSSAARSRPDGEVDFAKLGLYVQRDQPLGEGFSLTLAAEAQLTRDRLLSSEEYGVGGKSFGLAYDGSEVTGENGGAARAELSWTTRSDGDGAMVAQPFVYVDGGGANNRDDGSTGANKRAGWQTLWSAGVGTRLFYGGLSAGLLLAKPFSDHGAETGHPWRAFFTLSARF